MIEYFYKLIFVYISFFLVMGVGASLAQSEGGAGTLLSDSTLEGFTLKQRLLAFEKGGRVKRIYYKVGDRINFYLKNDETLYRPFIQKILPASFITYQTQVPLEQVSAIVIYRDSWFVNQGSVYLPMAGVGYFLMDMINPIFSQNEAFVFSKPTLFTSSILILGGLSLQLLKKRKHQLGNRKYLKIIDRY